MTETNEIVVLNAKIETLEAKLQLSEKNLSDKQNELTQLFLKYQDLITEKQSLENWKKIAQKQYNIPE